MRSSIKDVEMNGATVAGNALPLSHVIGFLLVCFLPFVLAWDLTKIVATLVLSNDSFSQILLIPFVSLFFVYEGRKRIFSAISCAWVVGTALIAPGLIFLLAARLNLLHVRLTNQGALFVFGIVLIWLGAFGLFFGTQAFRGARFPLLFLLFSVPIPEPILSVIFSFLQRGSADAAAGFFQLAGVPYLRQDLIFRLPGVSIRVAEGCSGIRSSLALFITTVLAGYLYLRSTWKRLLLCAVVVPLAIFKNGLRIATLSTVAIYVNPGFLYGNLHHRGGIVFFMLALVPMALFLIWLQKIELKLG
jgi:exosortase